MGFLPGLRFDLHINGLHMAELFIPSGICYYIFFGDGHLIAPEWYVKVCVSFDFFNSSLYNNLK
jgi:hypothetical protein